MGGVRRVVLAFMVTGVLLAGVAGCGSSSKSSTSATTAAASAATTVAGPSGAFAGGPSASGTTAPGSTATTVTPRQVVVTITATIRVTDIAAAAQQAEHIAAAAGGYVGNSNVATEGDANATVTLRVPPAAVTSVVDQLSGLGKVIGRTEKADDVTGQVVDLDSRIGTLRASIARLQDLIAKGTNVNDVAAIERELTTRESDLESLLGQRRVLGSLVELATITVSFVRPGSSTSGTKLPAISRAFHAGLSFVATIAKLIAIVVVWSAPLLVIAAIVLAIVLLVRRRRRRSTSSPVDPGPTSLPPPPPSA